MKSKDRMKIYKCLKCGYHYGRPWQFKDKEDEWKPVCRACGSTKHKFSNYSDEPEPEEPNLID